jgi:hypothetical protein
MKRRSFFQSAAAAVLGTIALVYAPSVVCDDGLATIAAMDNYGGFVIPEEIVMQLKRLAGARTAQPGILEL